MSTKQTTSLMSSTRSQWIGTLRKIAFMGLHWIQILYVFFFSCQLYKALSSIPTLQNSWFVISLYKKRALSFYIYLDTRLCVYIGVSISVAVCYCVYKFAGRIDAKEIDRSCSDRDQEWKFVILINFDVIFLSFLGVVMTLCWLFEF